MTRRRRIPTLGIGLLAGLTLAAGCSSSPDEEAEPTSTTVEESSSTAATSDVETTTTTIASTTTSTTAGAIDPATVEGPAEWVPTVVDVYNRLNALDLAPDPARVGDVFSEQYSGLQAEIDTQTFLVTEGVHADVPVRQVLRVEGPTDETGGTVQFVVTVAFQPFRLVYDDGRVFQEIADVQREGQELLRLAPDGPGGSYRVLLKEAV